MVHSDFFESYRTVYWTTDNGRIMKAMMDGTGSVQIVSGLEDPTGIVVDHKSSKIFWVDVIAHKVQSSGLDGGVVTTVVELSEFKPWGITMDADRLYVGNWKSTSELRSCTKTGGDMKTLYRGARPMQQLAMITARPPHTSRRNHCAGQTCSGGGICVLTASSFRCLSP